MGFFLGVIYLTPPTYSIYHDQMSGVLQFVVFLLAAPSALKSEISWSRVPGLRQTTG